METAIIDLLVNNGVSGILAVLIAMMLRSINQIKADFKTMTDAVNKKLYDPTTGKPHYRYASDCDRRMKDLEDDINSVGSKVNQHENAIQILQVSINREK